MDPKFQTSFIPRKNVTDAALPSRTAVGVFTLVAISLFIVAAGGAAGIFFWQQALISGNARLKSDLDTYEQRLTDPNIKELVSLNDRIQVASKHLAEHKAASSVFDLISADTLVNIRWRNFSFEFNDDGSASVEMTGEAKGFADVALQSDKILADSHFVNPLFSDVALGTGSTVQFSLHTTIDKKTLLYSTLVKSRLTPVTVDQTAPVNQPVDTSTSTNTTQ